MLYALVKTYSFFGCTMQIIRNNPKMVLSGTEVSKRDSLNIIQIMPGLEGDIEEWQTQEVNVTRGEAEGDIDLEGLPFLKVTRGPRHYLF